MDLVYRRKGISYEEGHPVDWSKTRRYNPATKTQYTDAIIRLKESGLPTAQIAAEFGLHPELFRKRSVKGDLFVLQTNRLSPNA